MAITCSKWLFKPYSFHLSLLFLFLSYITIVIFEPYLQFSYFQENCVLRKFDFECTTFIQQNTQSHSSFIQYNQAVHIYVKCRAQ